MVIEDGMDVTKERREALGFPLRPGRSSRRTDGCRRGLGGGEEELVSGVRKPGAVEVCLSAAVNCRGSGAVD